MERQLLERMVGAGVLIIALVVIGPALLDGGRSPQTDPDLPAVPADGQRTHTVRLNDLAATERPPPASVVPPPQAPVVPAAPAKSPPPSAVSIVSPPPAAEKTAAGPGPDRLAAAKPLADKATVPTPAPVPGKAPSSAGGWFVQVGTFGQRENAERLATQLKGKGFPASVSLTQRDGKSMHRVRVGPAGGRADAESLAARLASAGHRGQIVPP